MKLTYRYLVDGREIFVLDDCFTPQQVEELAAYVGRASYSRAESSRNDTNAYRHFVSNFPATEVMGNFLGDAARQAIRRYFPSERHGAFRTYCNMGLYGDSAYTHKDCKPGTSNITALVFANPKWELDWGGETLFYNDAGDCVVGVNPRPGRMILFRGAITHRAGLAIRECYTPRYTVALKFGPVRQSKPQPGSVAAGRNARKAKPRRAVASRSA